MPDGTDGTSLTAFGQQTDALKGLWLAAFGVKRRGRLAKGVFVRSAHPTVETALAGAEHPISLFLGEIEGSRLSSVSYVGQIPRCTVANCKIQPLAAPDAGKLAGILREFRGY